MTIDKSTMIGSASPKAIAEYLELIGDTEAAAEFHRSGGGGQSMVLPFVKYVWGQTGAKIGFIPEGTKSGSCYIVDAIGMEPDESLRETALKISLDAFYVHNYPGMGKHRILCEFSGKNQTDKESEAMRFAVDLAANDQSAAAHIGQPIFVGVNVGREGLSFEGRTVNVKSEDDDLMLEALGNSTFKDGLSLLTTAQPVLKPFVKLAEGLVASVAKRSENREVFKFALGLDFSKSATSAKLRLGSYVVVQTDEHDWDWSSFVWSTGSGLVLPKADGAKPLKLNYMVFGVGRAGA
ncbi:hypothetical protein BMW22_41730 (plasmid) [Rhizobium leguminosarum]|uniref:Uncharacterized protein n=1 Tax=Rhizobium leguminosarum TaxID=384 RepID=A0A1L3ZQ48_RHILE|nr:hypothetical protein [Rhizobium leguminosarum]API57779.1 hypothetical protein BMW22_41730 [Rhizobium leguminosarum]